MGKARPPMGLRSTELSEREMEVLLMLADGLPQETIAHRMHVAGSTMKSHIGSIYRKLGVVSAAQAVATAYRRGLVRPPRPDGEFDVRARLTVLEAAGWPDDRDQYVGPLPAGWYWEMAGRLVRALTPIIRREVADEADQRLRTVQPSLTITSPSLGEVPYLRQDLAAELAGRLAVVPAADHTTTDQGGPDGRC